MVWQDWRKLRREDEYDESVLKDMPKYPGASLAGHILMKSVQVGSILGTVSAIGAVARYRLRGIKTPFFERWAMHSGRGGFAGMIVGAAIIGAKAGSIDQDGLEDRAYRLRLNKGVLGMDFYSVVGGLAFLVVGSVMGRRIPVGLGTMSYYSPSSSFMQGIAVGSLTFHCGSALGLPVFKPMQALGVRPFQKEDERPDPAASS